MQKFVVCICYIFVSFIILPAIITFSYKGFQGLYQKELSIQANEIGEQYYYLDSNIDTISYLKILNPINGQVEYLNFEEYLIGVVAAEMPALFEIEALKAQAVASRTFAIGNIDIDKVYTDLNINTTGQAYLTIEQMKERWGDNFDIHYDKISTAVYSTKGELILYQEEPILAVFHATSSGVTEYSSDVWQAQRPYLVSVDSSFDESVPGFITEANYTENEFISIMRQSYPDIIFSNEDLINQIVINELTSAGAVKSVTVGNKTMSGRDLRTVLNLRSSNFTVRKENDNIIFTTKGHGHGAGMSQTGANILAQQGFTYKEILTHYYQGVTIK